MRAQLIADGGAAAASGEFFRCAEFLAAEQVSHSLQIETGDGELLAPLVVREIPGADLRDAVSPYGYPGVVAAGGDSPPSPISHDAIDWSQTELVSAFIRGTALGPFALSGSERSTLQLSDPGQRRKSRMSDRQQIRRNESSGYRVEIQPGPEAGEERREGFLDAYTQTMIRTGASERYFFDRAWFDRVLSNGRTWLVSLLSPTGGTAAASLGVLSDGVLHYFLSGSSDEHLRDAPMKNVIVALQDLSESVGVLLNLGGGLRPGDGLEEFKRGFANTQRPFVTHEIICDRKAYGSLSAGRGPAAGFFPAYRAP